MKKTDPKQLEIAVSTRKEYRTVHAEFVSFNDDFTISVRETGEDGADQITPYFFSEIITIWRGYPSVPRPSMKNPAPSSRYVTMTVLDTDRLSAGVSKVIYTGIVARSGGPMYLPQYRYFKVFSVPFKGMDHDMFVTKRSFAQIKQGAIQLPIGLP